MSGLLATRPDLQVTYLAHELDQIIRDYARVGVDRATVRRHLLALLEGDHQ